MVGRDPDRLERTRAELLAEGGGAVGAVVADMSSLASVRAAADEVLAVAPRIDVLVDNAGAMYPTRQVSPDGIEMSLATMVVGPVRARRTAVAPAGGLPGPDGSWRSRREGCTPSACRSTTSSSRWATYEGARAYARAKRAQVALVREWARRLRGRGSSVNAMHPGWADTPGLEASLPGFRSDDAAVCSGHPRRVPTPSSGSPRHPRQEP